MRGEGMKGRGVEVESGKDDTAQLTIVVLTGTSWMLSKKLGMSEPQNDKCVCVQDQDITRHLKTKNVSNILLGKNLLDDIEYIFDEVTDWSNTMRERLLLNCQNPIIDLDQNLAWESGEVTL